MKTAIGTWSQRPWGNPWSDDRALVSAAASIDEIGLSRAMCYGPCPAYVVRLHRSGSGEFFGEHFVDQMGPHVAGIAPEDVADLALAVLCLGFEELEANYAVDYTDAPSTSTWIVRRGGRVEVNDYGGAGPASLRAIEDLIDAAASELPWRPEPVEAEGEDGLPLFVGLDATEAWRPSTGEGAPVRWTQARGQRETRST